MSKQQQQQQQEKENPFASIHRLRLYIEQQFKIKTSQAMAIAALSQMRYGVAPYDNLKNGRRNPYADINEITLQSIANKQRNNDLQFARDVKTFMRLTKRLMSDLDKRKNDLPYPMGYTMGGVIRRHHPAAVSSAKDAAPAVSQQAATAPAEASVVTPQQVAAAPAEASAATPQRRSVEAAATSSLQRTAQALARRPEMIEVLIHKLRDIPEATRALNDVLLELQ